MNFAHLKGMARAVLLVALISHAGAWHERAFGADLYVPDDYPDIQSAIYAAGADQNVIVRDGVYTGSGNRDINLDGKALTVKSQNGPANCIIDCEGLGRAFYIQYDEDESTVIQGFTVRNGQASRGAAVYIAIGSPRFVACWFEDCVADSGEGGAVYVDIGRLNLESCRLTGNASGDTGGAVYVDFGDVYATDCTFEDNYAFTDGGAIHAVGECFLSGCEFRRNYSAGDAGAVYGDGYFIDCTFEDNEIVQAFFFGGAVYGDGFFANCAFRRNLAVPDGDAGAVYGGGTFMDCTFEDNRADYQGGAVLGDGDFHDCTFLRNEAYDGSAVHFNGQAEFRRCTFDSNVLLSEFGSGTVSGGDGTLTDCEFTNNSAGRGSGFAGRGILYRCQFTDNQTDGDDGFGSGAVYVDGSTWIVQCDFADNDSRYEAGGAIWLDSGSVLVRGCTFEKNSAGSGAGGAIYNAGAGLRVFGSYFCGNTPDHIGGSWTDQGQNSLYATCPCLHLHVDPIVSGERSTFTISGGTPGAKAVTVFGWKTGTSVWMNNRGYCATFDIKGINNSRVIGGWNRQFDSNGTISFSYRALPGYTGLNVSIQSAGHGTCPDECMSNRVDQVVG